MNNQAESESLNLNEPMSRDTGLSLLLVNLNNRMKRHSVQWNKTLSRFRRCMNASSNGMYLSIT